MGPWSNYILKYTLTAWAHAITIYLNTLLLHGLMYAIILDICCNCMGPCSSYMLEYTLIAWAYDSTIYSMELCTFFTRYLNLLFLYHSLKIIICMQIKHKVSIIAIKMGIKGQCTNDIRET